MTITHIIIGMLIGAPLIFASVWFGVTPSLAGRKSGSAEPNGKAVGSADPSIVMAAAEA